MTNRSALTATYLAVFFLFTVATRAVEIADLFKPFQTEMAALSPDGRHLAYTLREAGEMRIVIVNLESNRAKLLIVAEDQVAAMSGDREKTPSRVTFLRWATASRLIFSVEDLAVWGIDADGGNPKSLLRSRDITRPGLSLPPASAMSSSAILSQVVVGLAAAPGPEAIVLHALPDASLPSDEAEAAAEVRFRSRSAEQTYDVFESNRGSSVGDRYRPYVMDVYPEDPNTIFIQGRRSLAPSGDSLTPNANDLRVVLYKINVHSGKIISERDWIGASRLICDQQGRLRIAFTHLQTRRRFVYAASGAQLTRPLDDYLGDAFGFEFSPENFFQERSFPIAFDRNPEVLYYASNRDGDRFGIYALNLSTKKRTDFAVEHRTFDLADLNNPFPGGLLVMDRAKGTPVGVRVAGAKYSTIWLDPELAQIQAVMEKKFPEKMVEILEWDDARSRYLLLTSGQSDPGAFYLYEPAKGLLAERARRAPWIKEDEMSASAHFSIKGPSGGRLHGFITLPQNVRRTPIPLLVFCHDGPWNRDMPGFNRGAQALAAMGFAVLQVNFRGSSGFGRAHLRSLQAGVDRVALEDVLAAVDHFSGQLPVNRKLAAILGNGYGGYLALRALQLHPDRFKCAVAMNAPSDLGKWLIEPPSEDYSFARDVRRQFFLRDRALLAELSPVGTRAAPTAPVLIVHGEQNLHVAPEHAKALRRHLEKNGATPRYHGLPNEAHTDWLPSSYAGVFRMLGEFFNETIFNYEVGVGTPVEVK